VLARCAARTKARNASEGASACQLGVAVSSVSLSQVHATRVMRCCALLPPSQALAGVVDRLRWRIKRGDGGDAIRWRCLVVVSLPARRCPELPFKNPFVEGKQPESADDTLAVTIRASALALRSLVTTGSASPPRTGSEWPARLNAN